MLLLSAAAAGDTIPAQPDYIALAMVTVMFLVLIVMTVRKYLQKQKAATPAAQEESVVPAPTGPVKEAPGSAGHIKLHDVDPKTAAMLMAIVADKIGNPLNELRFISIKEVK